MNALRIFTSLYGSLHSKRMPVWVLTPLRRIIRWSANRILPIYLQTNQKYNYSKRNPNIIVSLTSFPARINEVWLVVETLKRQSLLPQKIILWLSSKQFPNQSSVPIKLLDEQDELFEIRFVDEDIRSYKKIYYALQEFTDQSIITFDDDVYYHPDTIKHLVDASNLYPNCVITNVGKRITYDDKGEVKPYLKWEKNIQSFSNDNIVQIGIGGVLYTPCSLNKLVTEKELFLKLAPFADDLWLNAMARFQGTKVIKTTFNYLPLPITSSAPKLSNVNCKQNMNDVQIMQINAYFKEHYSCKIY